MSILLSFGKPAWPMYENISIGFRIVFGPIGVMVFWMDVDGFLGKVKAWKDKMEESEKDFLKYCVSQKYISPEDAQFLRQANKNKK